MSRWWRAYDEAVDDPKLCLLSDRVHRAWFNLMCVASAYGGALPDIKIISLKLRMTPAKAQALIAELQTAELLDEIEGKLQPHNWSTRQFKSDVSNERVKRHRDEKRNADVTLHPPLLQRPQSTETEKKDGANAPIEEPNPEADLFSRGKKVLGKEAGGLIAKLLKANGGSIPKTRAVIEVASTKSNPREYVGGALRRNGSVKPEDRDWTEAVGFSSENIPWQESIG